MATDNPLISILMAVYNPRIDWLKEQLNSLEAQTYPNLRLYIRDDCSSCISLEEIKKCVEECIFSIPYELCQNEKNLGSNLTFEQLTKEAAGDYFAYCDQDDVWLPEKLKKLQEAIESTAAELVCSDMYIIDGNGKLVADSIIKIRRHHIFRSGYGLTDTLWYSNFASGCALLVKSSIAKEATPFNPFMYYDHYITLFSANRGKVVSLNQPLIYHREHGDNQSSTLQGVKDKQSYIQIRVDSKAKEIFWLKDHFVCGEALQKTLSEGAEWMQARLDYAHGERKKAKIIWKYHRYSPMASLFEIFMPYLPHSFFKVFIWLIRKNYIYEVQNDYFCHRS